MEPLIRELLEVPLMASASSVPNSGDKAPVDPEPAPVFPNLSDLVAKNLTDEPIATSADLVSEGPELRVPLISMDALHPTPADSCGSAVGSSDVESHEPFFLPDWETWTADGSQERVPVLLAQVPSARTVDEERETLERHSPGLASDEELASSKNEAPSEPSSVWRQLAQVVGRVVGTFRGP